ncbi:hypothetical protein [Actinoplanes sp. NPDC051859]|uniref:hypothetical protein n=1 Tax=Actinoplanes sp. NPDC051859 TaxID=3363909 RepID=UPI0037B9DE70
MAAGLSVVAAGALTVRAVLPDDAPDPATAAVAAAPAAESPASSAVPAPAADSVGTVRTPALPGPSENGSPAGGPARPSTAGTLSTVGRQVEAAEHTLVATVHTYRQPVAAATVDPGSDTEWGAADVEVCATAGAPGDIRISHLPWALEFADRTRTTAATVRYREFPRPGYPVTSTPLAPGACARGWITFPVPSGERPALIEWSPSNEPQPQRWRIA